MPLEQLLREAPRRLRDDLQCANSGSGCNSDGAGRPQCRRFAHAFRSSEKEKPLRQLL
jgi:hypothetical protein